MASKVPDGPRGLAQLEALLVFSMRPMLSGLLLKRRAQDAPTSANRIPMGVRNAVLCPNVADRLYRSRG